MPFERMGLGGVITLRSDPAVTALGRVKRATTSVRASFTQVNMSMAKLGSGLRTMTMAALPLAFGLLQGAKVAANFEHQMGAVASITGATGERFDALSAKAKEMGIVSAFSAQQSGEAMEFMARAGATDAEVMKGLSGVMNAAAADGMDLASAANIVAVVTKGMGREWSEATEIADILALASSKTNTNITALGESFVYGAATARDLGIKLSDTTAIFGALADSGLKGSLAGTAFTNMMNKLGKPTAKAGKLLKQWNIRLTDSKGNLMPMPRIVKDLGKRIKGLRNPIERAAVMSELFGIRGKRAFSALLAKGPAQLAKLFGELANATGSAARMAERRLSTLRGRITLFISSVQGAFIELFEPIMKPWAGAFNVVTNSINAVLKSVLELKKAAGKGVVAGIEAEVAILTNYGETALAVAQGFMDAIASMKAGWAAFTERVREAADWLRKDLGTEGLRRLSAVVIRVGLLAAAFVPVAAVLGAVVFVLKRALWPVLIGTIGSMWGLFAATAKLALGPMVWLGKKMTWVAVKAGKFQMIPMLKVMWFWMKKSGTGIKGKFIPALLGIGRAFKVVLAIGGPLFLVFGLLVSYLASMRREGEAVGGTLTRVFGGLWTAVKGFVTGFISGFGKIWGSLKAFGRSVVDLFDSLFGWLWESNKKTTDDFGTDWESAGRSFASVISGMVIAFSGFAITIREGVEKIRGWIQDLMSEVHKVASAVRFVASGFNEQIRREELRLHARIAKMREKDKEHFRGVISAKEKELEKLKMAGVEAEKREIARRPLAKPPEVKVDVDLTDNRTIENKNTLCVDGKEVATAVTRHTAEVHERAGFKKVPWQRRAALEFGAIDLAPAKASGTV